MARYPSERADTRRSSPRYACRLEVDVSCDGREQRCETYDVALSGAYVVTDAPAPINQVVHVTVHSPESKKPVVWMGRVVRVVLAEQDAMLSPPGMALAVFGMDEANRARWLTVLAGAARQTGEHPVVPLRRDPTPPEVPVATGLAHHDVPIDLTVRDVRGLVQLVSRNLASGGAFVPTGEHVAVGAWVDVRLHHPITAESFLLAARVARAERGGVSVEFAELPAEQRKRLQRFIVTGRSESPP